MTGPLETLLRQHLPAGSSTQRDSIPRLVDAILSAAEVARASDIHLRPEADGTDLSWRIDGLLQPVTRLSPEVAAGVVTRLKVLAGLLTYRTDVPQEGRLQRRPPSSETAGTSASTHSPQAVPSAAAAGHGETRLSTFPTVFGEKAVIRLMQSDGQRERIGQLGLTDLQLGILEQALLETGGAIVFCGPAGSGKTTTGYACLREILAASRGTRSIASLEDPVEVVIPGVAQSQVRPAAGFDLAAAVRSVLRQDPDVLAVGEIRDAEVASTVFQASLTGHLVVTTLHAGSTRAAIDRLLDLGTGPPVLRAGLRLLVCQRLLRRLCRCATPVQHDRDLCGLPVSTARVAASCEDCAGTGYSGRLMIAELARLEVSPGPSSGSQSGSASALVETVLEGGDLWSRALAAVEQQLVSPQEVIRVLGLPLREPAAERREVSPPGPAEANHTARTPIVCCDP